MVSHQSDHDLLTHCLRRHRLLGLLLCLVVGNGAVSCYSSDCGGRLRVLVPFQRVLINVLLNPLATLVRLFHRFVEQYFVLLLQFLEFRQEHVLHLLHLLSQLILHSLHLDKLFLRAFLIARFYLLILILLLKVALGLHIFRFLM